LKRLVLTSRKRRTEKCVVIWDQFLIPKYDERRIKASENKCAKGA